MIRLEPFESKDFGRLIQWVDSEKMMYLFGGSLFEYPVTFEQLVNYVGAENRLIYKAC